MGSDPVTVSFEEAGGTSCAGQRWVGKGRKEAGTSREEALPTARETAGARSAVRMARRCSWGVRDIWFQELNPEEEEGQRRSWVGEAGPRAQAGDSR